MNNKIILWFNLPHGDPAKQIITRIKYKKKNELWITKNIKVISVPSEVFIAKIE